MKAQEQKIKGGMWIAIGIIVWSAIGLYSLGYGLIYIYVHSEPDFRAFGLAALSFLSAFYMYSGGRRRRVVGAFWALIAMVGFFGLVIETAGLQEVTGSFQIMIIGLITSALIFLPEPSTNPVYLPDHGEKPEPANPETEE